MKNQASRILFVFISMGFVLLGIGCSPDPSPNNQSNLNQNTSNQNASNEAVSSDDKAPPPVCTSVDEAALKAEIAKLPGPLKEQFNDGNISLSYADNKLIFKGSIYGNGNILPQLLNGFGKFRGKDCVKAISFQGNTADEKFKWCPTAGCPTRVPDFSCYVRNIVETSRIKYQLGHNLFYNYNKGNDGVLEFMGFVGDKPNSGQFSSLFGELQNYMNNECITKITFAAGSTEDGKTLSDAGFGWLLCESPNCECAGECRAICPCGGPTPDANANANISNSP